MLASIQTSPLSAARLRAMSSASLPPGDDPVAGLPRALRGFSASLEPALGALPPGTDDETRSTPNGDNVIGLQDFELLSVDEGWLLLRQRLYWTGDGGQSWNDITPAAGGTATIQAVAFADTQTGWVALTAPDEDGFPRYRLAQTRDGGHTWELSALSLFAHGDVSALAGAVYLDVLDPQTAWLVVKRATSRNFSLGTLFQTTDGGRTWTRGTLPIGEPVHFVTRDSGWTAGGAAGDELYRTEDGGQSWQVQAVPHAQVSERQHRLYQLPTFEGALRGVLPVVARDGDRTQVEFYVTDDGGESWRWATAVPTHRDIAPGTRLPVSVLDAERWLLMVPFGSAPPAGTSQDKPGRAQLVRTLDRGATTARVPQDSLAAGVTRLDMATPERGWAQYASGQCTTGPAPGTAANQPQRQCIMEVRLTRTADGGRTWQVLRLPSPDSPQGPSAPGEIYAGQGFDSCTKPPLGQMLTWYGNSPYRAWNLYIGGSNRANCGTLTESFIESLAGQGWKLIPTWVGPQAACTSFRSRMSYDPATAYQQGAAEADAAFSTATALGLTPPDTAGAMIYYDLEAYSVSNPACREAARAFISGWTSQLRAHGSQVGVYGSTCGSALSDFASITHVPDAIWAAVWIVPYQYRPEATVWNLPCLDNSLWSASQRLRQYSGGHDETWGGVTLNIDSDVLDGIVGVVPNPCPQADGVTLYWNASYDCQNGSGDLGYRQRTTTGWQNVHDASFNDQASSLRVPAGWSARLFQHTDRGGSSVCYRTDIADFSTQGDFPGTSIPINENVSSMEAFDNGSCASDWQQSFFSDTNLDTACGVSTERGVYLFSDSLAGWSLPAGCPGVEGAWSARMARDDAWFDGGTYEFGLFYDEAARLYVDGALVVDGWSATQHYGSRTLSAGGHQLILEYKNDGDRAIVQLWWRGPGALPVIQAQEAGRWWVSYWGNQSQWGDPVTSQNEGTGFVERNWGNDGPGVDMPDDHFSTRFERTIDFACGTYALHLRSDDGSRLAVDGVNQPQFDHWSPGIWETTANVTLAAGNHTLRIDQFENTGGASLHFDWTLTAPCPLAPALYLPLVGHP